MWYYRRLGRSPGGARWGDDEQSKGSLCTQSDTGHHRRKAEGKLNVMILQDL